MKTYTLVEMDEDGRMTREVFRAPDDTTAVARAQLASQAHQVMVLCGDRLIAMNDEVVAANGTLH